MEQRGEGRNRSVEERTSREPGADQMEIRVIGGVVVSFGVEHQNLRTLLIGC